MPIIVEIIAPPENPSFMEHWVSITAEYETESEHEDDHGDEDDMIYDPINPRFMRVVGIIDDGDGGVKRVIAKRWGDMGDNIDITNASESTYCEFDPKFFAGAISHIVECFDDRTICLVGLEEDLAHGCKIIDTDWHFVYRPGDLAYDLANYYF